MAHTDAFMHSHIEQHSLASEKAICLGQKVIHLLRTLKCNKSLNREYHYTLKKINHIQFPSWKKIKHTIFYKLPTFIENIILSVKSSTYSSWVCYLPLPNYFSVNVLWLKKNKQTCKQVTAYTPDEILATSHTARSKMSSLSFSFPTLLSPKPC